ncbi:MAG TPA: prepilin-type N-terminal cleavage/methylation domain-containing protein [Anaeromyxobacteraceae bacterium]|nr:prepilin-type N-terminal cleavage/methylation domain-containing protein [Anaeromyxobacteraceae bacterium]
MSARRNERGTTLVEALVAMAILMVGAVGTLGLHYQGQRMELEARGITRATAIAQDLMSQIQTWPYADPRLADANAANDGDFSDNAFAFETQTPPPFDHAEADLTLNGLSWNGIQGPGSANPVSYIGAPCAAGTQSCYERYWNVSQTNADGSLIDSNGNGVPDGVHIAVLVRWQEGTTWHRIVLVGFMVNPLDTL